MLLPMLIAAAAPDTAAPARTTPAAAQALRQAIGAILRANGPEARATLLSVPDGALDARDRTFRACSLERLSGTASQSAAARGDTDPFADSLLAAYRRYWRAGVASPAARGRAEADLLAEVTRLVGAPPSSSPAAVDDLVAKRLARAGLHAQQGRTGLLQDLMIWSEQTERRELVRLPEGDISTRVVYLNGFISLGWSSYLSCDRTGTGGWTTPDALFVIVPSYKSLVDENFRVNFLAHESQHFFDMRRFGELPQWRLEYRAKLVEVAEAMETRDKVLAAFESNQGDDPADAHSYADRKLLVALRERLGLAPGGSLATVSSDRLRDAAVAELRSDSDKLDRDRAGEAPTAAPIPRHP